MDPSLLRSDEPWLQKTRSILDEMISRGNLIAGLRKAELQQLDETLIKLQASHTDPGSARNESIVQDFGDDLGTLENFPNPESVNPKNTTHMHFEPLNDRNSEGVSVNQLVAVADSLDFGNIEWSSTTPLSQLDSCLY